MRLEAALQGNLQEFIRKQQHAITDATRKTVTDVSLSLRDELREQTEAAGLGRLGKSWKRKLYIDDLAALVYTDSPRAILAFEKGGTFVSPDGFWLAIPTENAPRKGVGGGRISPSNFPETALGKLRFVYVSSKLSLLVADNMRARTGKRAGFTKASASALKTGRGFATVPMFILVPRVRVRKRLNLAGVQGKWREKLAQHLANEINRLSEDQA